jgi:hypothetical protein
MIGCNDLVLDPTDGSAWVALDAGLGRLRRDGRWAVMGAPLSTSRHDRIALAWNDERRQLWALDASGALRVLDVSR